MRALVASINLDLSGELGNMNSLLYLHWSAFGAGQDDPCQVRICQTLLHINLYANADAILYKLNCASRGKSSVASPAFIEEAVYEVYSRLKSHEGTTFKATKLVNM